MSDFKIPRLPVDLFQMPFAHNGNKSVIPTETRQHGRATLPNGFPTETQLPLRQGGVAPNRMDFNGILYMLSAFAFWQQSGGMWLWNENLHYTVPNLVYHKDKLWWCTKENGPEQGGTKEPGAMGSEEYWLEFLLALAGMMGTDITQLFGNPVGSLLMWPTVTAPQGYFPCFGQPFSASDYPKLYAVLGKAKVPDFRGYFPRCYDPTALRDPQGGTRNILSAQSDAGINITGSWVSLVQYATDVYSSGCVSQYVIPAGENGGRNGAYETPHYNIDASRQWGAGKVSSEFRGVNKSVLFCIKHD